jgi:hypothetical protein
MADAERPPTPKGREAAPTTEQSVRRHAELALRVAWLRVQGHLMFEVDTTGQTSAQLWDFADLLEVLDVEGRWGR